MTNLTDRIFTDETAARAHFARHCGTVDLAKGPEGKGHRSDLCVCRACCEHFTVTVRRVMESSHVLQHK
ncbi:hypothetical protein [Methylocystis heyeri]|uniref:Uncharacterized protein n=1 Tax=Methylocystis heyeri TaxID=391905 RepID=A0A6B8KDU0_9HYPH|nr:hypothetical protein [Methylocystis heyeri]QGM45847.1 hypothetical protein H2LOC_009110 [Methylocystis heyeri]